MKKVNVMFFIAIVIVTFCSCKKDDVKPKETVVYETDFSNDDGYWYTGTTDNGTIISLTNGYYTLKCGASGGHDTWVNSIFNNSTNNTSVEASVKVSTTGADIWGNGGLMWDVKRLNSADYIAFYFSISHNGYYTIYGYPDGINAQDYVDWTINSAVKKEAFNKLKISLTEGKLHFYINDIEVYSMAAVSSVGTLDQVGINASKYSTVQVDYFKATAF